jgi:hypothetical protein
MTNDKMTPTTPSPISDQAAGELRVLPKDVLDALRFYAHGDHYSIDDDHQSFDTVSGEPANWMFSEKEDDCTMFEDGGIARAVLAGRSAGFEEPVEPFEGEVFTGVPATPSTVGVAVAWRWRERNTDRWRFTRHNPESLPRVPAMFEPLGVISTAPTTGSAPVAGTLTIHDVQKKAIEHGFEYWRAPDAHGVTGTKPQAIELLQDLLGVEVEIEDNGCSTCNGTGMIGGPSFYAPDEGGERCPDCNAPASPVASVLSEDAILAIAVDHGLGTAVVESIAKDLLAASMGGDRK